MKDKLLQAAKEYDGGVIRFISYLDKENVIYELTPKKPTARITLATSFGKIRIYDRKTGHKIRVDIPWRHPLSCDYEKYDGYLYNESNKDFKTQSYKSVYFDEQVFDRLVKYIKVTA